VQNYQNPAYPSVLSGRTLVRRSTLTLTSTLRLALVCILLLALALRFWGLAFGLPYIVQPDEPSVEGRALDMWLKGNPDAHYYVYPSFFYDLQALWAILVGHVAALVSPDILRHPRAHLPAYYLAGRALTALMGTLTVLVTYLTGRRLAPRLGLIAALFLAVAAQHVQQSHYITVDAPTALFTALAALFAVRALTGESARRDIVLAGLAAGLAGGTKYNAGVALTLPLAAALLTHARSWRWRLGVSAAATAVAAVVFALSIPFALRDWSDFVTSMTVVPRHYMTGHPGAEGNDNAVWYLLYLARDGMLAPMTLLAVAGLVAVVARYRRAGVVLLAFALPYYAVLCGTYVRFDRNLLPLLPFLALFAAAAAEAVMPPVIRALRNHVAAYAIVLGVAVVPSLYVAAYAGTQSDFAITHPFSEEAAVAWVDAYAANGATIATENWEGRPFGLSPRRYRIINHGTITAETYDWYRAHGVRYIVVDSYTDDAYLRSPRRYPVEAARYRELYRRGRLLQRITGDSPLRPGPTMSIYGAP